MSDILERAALVIVVHDDPDAVTVAVVKDRLHGSTPRPISPDAVPALIRAHINHSRDRDRAAAKARRDADRAAAEETKKLSKAAEKKEG